MRLLLDTHILIWAVSDPNKLTPATHALLLEPANQLLFSAASIWEIAIKAALRRADFGVAPAEIAAAAVAAGLQVLPIGVDAALRVATLPAHHRDPFDRLLIAQAMCEPAILLTVDRFLPRYSEPVRLAA
jgi:PIN domain nuclease of toxin-antitoxin system